MGSQNERRPYSHRGYRATPRSSSPVGDGTSANITGLYTNRSTDGPWTSQEFIDSLTGGNEGYSSYWEAALVKAGQIPDYFVQGTPKQKFIRDLRMLGASVVIARKGINARDGDIEDSGEHLDEIHLGYQIGGVFAAEKAARRIIDDASRRVHGENIRPFAELSEKLLFQNLSLTKRGIRFGDINHPDVLIESSGLAQWYRYVADCQRIMIQARFGRMNSQGQQDQPDPFLKIAAPIVLLSHSDPKYFNQAGSREFKAVGREAQGIVNNLQHLRSQTLIAFLDKDHPEHLGVVEAISQSLRSQDPRVRKASMIYLRGDTMMIELYREAEFAAKSAVGLEVETYQRLMDEIERAAHESFPHLITSAKEFPLMTNEDLRGGYGTDMATLQRKAISLLKITGAFGREFLPDNFKWGDFKKPKGAKFSIVKNPQNRHLVLLDMTFDTPEGEKVFQVYLDPDKGIMNFPHVLSVNEEQVDFVGSLYHLLGRVIDRVRGDISNKPLPATQQVSEKSAVQIQPRRVQTATPAGQLGSTRIESSRLKQEILMPSEEELNILAEGFTSQERDGYVTKLQYAIKGGLKPLPLRYQDAYSPEGNRQFELKFKVEGSGGRIILELVKGRSGVETLRVREFRRKTDMDSMTTRSGMRKLKKS